MCSTYSTIIICIIIIIRKCAIFKGQIHFGNHLMPVINLRPRLWDFSSVFLNFPEDSQGGGGGEQMRT